MATVLDIMHTSPRAQRWFSFAVLTALLVVPQASCKKDEKATQAATPDLLEFVPKDAQGVLSISPSRLFDSAPYKGFMKKMVDAKVPEDKRAILPEYKKCGIDVTKDIGSVVIAASENGDKVMIAMSGNFDQKKAEACVSTLGGTVADGIYTVDGKPLNAYWPNDKVMLLSKKMSTEDMKASLANGTVKDNAEMMKLVEQARSGATIWGAGIVPSEMQANLKGAAGVEPKSAHMSLKLDTGFSLAVGTQFDAEDAAKKALQNAEMGQKQVLGSVPPAIAPAFKKIKLGQSGKVVTASLELTSDEAAQLVFAGVPAFMQMVR